MLDAVLNLLDLGAIEICNHEPNEFISSYFLRKKSDGSNRFILNLVNLNKFIKPNHFKMEDLKSACKILNRNDYLCTVDLKNAFLLVNLDCKSRKYIRFIFDGKLYQFLSLPFSLCLSPLVFTKIMRPVFAYLRIKGFRSNVYLDDCLLYGSSYEKCLKNLEFTINTLETLGLIVNYEKSNFIPSNRCKFLGCIIDSIKFTVELTENRKSTILTKLNSFKYEKHYKIRDYAQLQGLLVSAFSGVEYGMMYSKNLETDKTNALKLSNGNFEEKMKISKETANDLEWWKKNITISYRTIKEYNFELEIFTDASLTGWGAICNGEKSRGFWSREERKNSINYLELLAVYLALKAFAYQKKNCEILLRIDNTTAISYVNRMGGSRHIKYNHLAAKIWKFAEKQKLWLYASYIPSAKNVEADAQSRV